MTMADYSGDSLRRQFLGADHVKAAQKADEALADVLHDQSRLLMLTGKGDLKLAFRCVGNR